jgi:choline kinase
MQAVILAAGLGNRLGELTRTIPKALVRVDRRELILHALGFLEHPAITERIVVTGYRAPDLTGFLREQHPKAKLVHNPRFTRGSILSIETALSLISGEFLLMNVDHIYPGRLLTHILERRRGLMAMCDFDRSLGPDDMKVKLDEQGLLADIRKTLDSFDGGYIGMTYCAASLLDSYRQAVQAVLKSCGHEACVEQVLDQASSDGQPVGICDTSGMRWLEVDTPEDLERAESVLAGDPNFLL